MIEWVIIIALVGFFFQLIIDPKEEMVLSFYGRWLARMSCKSRFWKYIAKPLGTCITCNTTWIGLLFFYLVAHYDIMICLALSCAAAALATFIQVIHAKLLG